MYSCLERSELMKRDGWVLIDFSALSKRIVEAQSGKEMKRNNRMIIIVSPFLGLSKDIVWKRNSLSIGGRSALFSSSSSSSSPFSPSIIIIVVNDADSSRKHSLVRMGDCSFLRLAMIRRIFERNERRKEKDKNIWKFSPSLCREFLGK